MKSRNFWLLSLFLLTLFSCNDKDISIVNDYRFKTSINTADGKPLEDVYVNTPVKLLASIKPETDIEIDNYTIKYRLKGGDGVFKILDKKLEQNTSLDSKEELYPIVFFPAKKGTQTIELEFTNGHYVKRDSFKVNTNKSQLAFQVSSMPSKVVIDKSFSFGLTLEDAISSVKNYKVQSSVIKGDGEIFINNPNLVESDEETQTIGVGTNNILYKSKKVGENVIQFEIENEYGFKQVFNVELDVKNPAFNISVKVDDDAKLKTGIEKTFVLNITDTDKVGNNSYKISYRPKKSEGKLKINSKELKTGDSMNLKEGDNVCSFECVGIGSAELEFIVTDKYGTSKSIVQSFKVENSKINLDIKNLNNDVVLNQETLFNMGIIKPNYNKGYKIEFIQKPLKNGLIKIDNKVYTGGKLDVANPLNTKISFIPKHIENTTLSIIINDCYGGVIKKDIILNTSNPSIKTLVSNYTSDIEYFNETFFNLEISKPFYDKSYKIEFLQTPLNSGVLKIDNKVYTGGKLELKNPLNTKISFIPKTKENINLEYIIYDEFNTQAKSSLNFNVICNPITIDIKNFSSSLVLGSESSFNFITSKLDYKDSYKLELLQTPLNSGVLKIDDKVYTGGKLELKNPLNTKISFIPNSTKSSKLKLIINDIYNESITKELSFNVNDPSIKTELTNLLEELILGKESSFNISTTKEHYTNKFKISLSQEPINSGVLKIDDKVYTGGKLELKNPLNTKISFIPAKQERTKINLIISDCFDNNITKEVSFNIKNPAIESIVRNYSSDAFYYKKSSFNLEITKPFYTEQFTICFDQNPLNSGVLEIDDRVYTGGRVAIKNPLNTKISFTPKTEKPITLTYSIFDKYNTKKEDKLIFNVTNNPIITNITNLESELTLGNKTSFNLNTTKENYSKGFKIEFSQEPLNSGLLEIDNRSYNGGKINLSSNTLVNFIPKKEGNTTLRLTITDDFDNSITKIVKYNVVNPPIVASSNHSENVLIRGTKSTTLNFSKKNYNGDYWLKVENSPQGSSFSIENYKNYKVGERIKINPTNLIINFTPLTTGAKELRLKVYDEYNTERLVVLNYNVLLPSFSISSSNNSININSGESKNISLIFKSSFSYKTPLKIKLEYDHSKLKLLWNNEEVSSVTSTLNKNNTLIINPNNIGTRTIKIIATDEFNNSVSKNISVVSSLNNIITPSFLSGNYINNDKPRVFTLSLNSSDKNNRFTVTVNKRLKKMSGSNGENASNLSAPSFVTIGSSCNISFEDYATNYYEEKSIQITVKDRHGNTKVLNCNYSDYNLKYNRNGSFSCPLPSDGVVTYYYSYTHTVSSPHGDVERTETDTRTLSVKKGTKSFKMTGDRPYYTGMLKLGSKTYRLLTR